MMKLNSNLNVDLHKKYLFYHEAHEVHEGKNYKIIKNFVFFVNFVVQINLIIINRNSGYYIKYRNKL